MYIKNSSPVKKRYCFLKTRERVDLPNHDWNQFPNFRSHLRKILVTMTAL